jgi:hypothetical protein
VRPRSARIAGPELFDLHMRALLEAADDLHTRVRILTSDPAMRESTEVALEQARTLCSMSANDVIERLSTDKAALAVALRSSEGRDSLRLHRRVGLSLEPYGIGISTTVEPDRYHLFVQPPDNHSGKVPSPEAHWGHRAQLPLRVVYRLTLMLQHWLSAPLHRMTEPCQPAGRSFALR